MAVFRIEKTRDYTVMSNHHLRNTELSLKAKGLLSLMLSLPEDWDYTMRGLSRICKDGIDSIRVGVQELEAQGYLVRQRVRLPKGQLGSVEYTILEQPRPPQPEPPKTTLEKPMLENPTQVKPILDSPMQEIPTQLNIDILNTNQSRTDISNPIQSNPPTPGGERMGLDGMGARDIFTDIIRRNIDYDGLSQDPAIDQEQLDEILELIVETVCSARKTIRVAGDDFPAEVVRSRFLKLNSSHVQYVMDCMKENTTYIRNIKKYLLQRCTTRPAPSAITIPPWCSMICPGMNKGGGGKCRKKSPANPSP